MQDRTERDENRAARLAEAKRQFREDTRRQGLRYAMAIYRARLIALGLTRDERTSEFAEVSSVIPFRRAA